MLILCGLTNVIAACAPASAVTIDGPKTPDAPLVGGPSVSWTDDAKTGFHVELAAALQKHVDVDDQAAFVVAVAGEGGIEVARYPIASGAAGTTVRQRVELPIGDYAVEVVYRNQHFSGDPFRIAMVPEWGGTHDLHLFRNHGTRVSMAEKKLWVLRWRSNDAPAPPWIVEWRHAGQVVTTTSGREPKWSVGDAATFVKGALAPLARRSIWQLGEEYAVPEQVAALPGAWEARVVHAGQPPVAVDFTVMPGGAVGEVAPELVAVAGGWAHVWSRPLELRAVASTDVVELADRLVAVGGGQQIAEGPIELTPGAVRALFRSHQLADTWTKFLLGSRELKPAVERLIKQNEGPWKPSEFPRS